MNFAGALVVLTAMLSSAAWAGVGSGKEYGARDPAKCEPLRQTKPPSPEQAAALVRCRIETEHTNELWLMKDVKVELGGGRPYNRTNDTSLTEVDVKAQVHPVRGSYVWSICNTRSSLVSFNQNPDLNCREADVTQATGACWRTTFGDWSCTMGGSSAGEPRRNQPPLK